MGLSSARHRFLAPGETPGAMAQDNLINVELVFASEEKQSLLSVRVVEGITARDAIAASELPKEFPEFDFMICPLGIWGRPVDGAQVLKEGDRVEAYRKLWRDPREARRELALAGKSMGSSAKNDDP